MHKIKWGIFLVILTALITVTASAEESVNIEVESSTELQSEITTEQNKLYSKNLSIMKSFKAVVSKTKYDEKDLSAYNYFISSLSPTDSEILYINSLVAKGYDIEYLVVIYVFWKDTAENLNIIETVYNNRPDDYENNPYWVDDTFLKLSKEDKTIVTYSDLSVAEVREYLNDGYTYEELIYAERLSRKGILSMEKILENRGQNKTWNDILISVYNIDFTTKDASTILDMNLSLQTLNIVDAAIKEKTAIISEDSVTGFGNGLYAEKLFEGYDNFIVNAEIIRELKF